MGYYTTFTLSASDRGEDIETWISELTDDPDNYYLKMLEPYGDATWGMNAKWYESDEDMCRVSLAFPEVEFVLDGSGEETGDIWRDWFINGSKYAHWSANITIPNDPGPWRV